MVKASELLSVPQRKWDEFMVRAQESCKDRAAEIVNQRKGLG